MCLDAMSGVENACIQLDVHNNFEVTKLFLDQTPHWKKTFLKQDIGRKTGERYT